jgi:hypothetical protein
VLDRETMLDMLVRAGWAWDEAVAIADGKPVTVTVGGETFRWFPLAESFGYPSPQTRLAA